MNKDIENIYKHSQSQISNQSFKSLVLSSIVSQTSSSIKLTTTSVPSVRYKKQKNPFCVPKIPSIMMQPSQIMATYSIVRQQENIL